MKKNLTTAILLCTIAVSAKEKPHPTVDSTKTSKKNAIEEKTKACKKYDGLFTIYQDTITGSAYMVIKEAQLTKEYIYFAYTENGIVETGHFRGNFRDNRVFGLKKYYDKIEFVSKNTHYYFDQKNPLSKSAEANVNDAVLLSLKISASDTTKKEYLLDANSIYLSEGLHMVKPPIPNIPGLSFMFFNLGSLNREKCKYVSIKNYPKNTDIVVDLVFDNPSPSNGGSGAVADARAVTIRLQHTLIEMPDNEYKPRRDDPRIGYFSTLVEDMTSTSPTPYKDVIHRWHLEKKDKNAALSEPVEPITWWIEKTTPYEFRSTIKEAGLKWNLAFEKAGFKNAIHIEEQPDTATWDAGDIRYNVLRWTSSPNPPFGGYGPSFVNPRTGQILGADIMLEYIFVTNRLKQEQLFDAAGINFDKMVDNNTGQKQTNSSSFYTQFSKEAGSNAFAENNFCNAANFLQQQNMLGMIQLQATGATEIEIKEYIKQSLYYLVLHEMGHTMGLNHNMKASQMLYPEQLNDTALTHKLGLTASVMDYPAVNLSADKKNQGQYFTMKPGPYDDWAIEYAYSQATDEDASEEKRLQKILSHSTDSLLIFGNDADDMRGSYSGIDPRINIGDMSKDALSYSEERFKLTDKLMAKLKDKYNKPEQSYQELKTAFLILSGEAANAAITTSRYVGGIYIDRGFIGQSGSTRPYTPVPVNQQKKAMSLLSKYVFAPDAFNRSSSLYPYLQTQRRSFNFFGRTEDPKIHDRINMIQNIIINHLLAPNTLKRLTDSRLYGNTYGVTDMMEDLTKAIFTADISGNVNTLRQNLQSLYVDYLIDVTTNSFFSDYVAKANATSQLKLIQTMLSAPSIGVNKETTAHRQFVLLNIKQAFEKK